MFQRLWLGHLYMGSKCLPMHSPQSPVCDETLARCTRTVYPLRFLRTAAHRRDNVFHRLWLGPIYMGSKGLPMHSFRSPVYGETLAHCTRVVYPPRFLRMAVHRWDSVFIWHWLGHMYMGSKGLPMHSSRSPVYGETLAPCTRAVYPQDFFGRRQAGGLVCSIGFG
jgi:hypothetical protein